MRPKSRFELVIENASLRQRLARLEADMGGHTNGEATLSTNAEQNPLETALKATETRFRRLFETAKDGILILDADTGAIIDANPFLEDMFGYTRAGLIGKGLWEISPFQQIATSREAFLRSLTQDYIRYDNLPLEPRGERTAQVEFVSNLHLANGTRVIQCSIRDITERKQAEKALEEIEEKFHGLFEASSDAIFIHDARTGAILDVNQTMLKMYGWTLEECAGLTVADLSANKPEHSQRVALEKINEADERGLVAFEWLARRKDGSLFPVEVTLKKTNLAGEPCILANVRDITERKRAEEALREKEEFIRAFLETSKDWIWAIDLRGVHTYSNPAIRTILGYELEEIIGTSSFSLMHEEDRDLIQTEVNDCLEARRGWNNLVVRWRHKAGGYRYLESSSVPVLGAGGEVTGFRGVDRDITERTLAEAERLEMERRLLHAQRLESLGVLAGGIAHDFNNLLMAVIGNLDLALLDLSPAPTARDYIDQALLAARRGTDLTRQMLACSGKARFTITRKDLSQLVRENSNLFRTAVPRTVSMNLCLTSECTAIEADPSQVHQVIMNLITNASEAIGENPGMIALKTGVEVFDAAYLSRSRLAEKLPEGRFAYVEVSDTGCGMEDGTVERLFDPFFTTKFTGRGLGMAAVLGIVRAHKGAVMVQSAVGRGSTIRVLFPAVEVPGAAKDDDSVELADEPGAMALVGTVLVVDDEEAVRGVCAAFAERLGLQAITAADGEEGLGLFKRHADKINCVLLDFAMPHMDGISAFREMHRLRPDIPVILCSGYDERDATQHFSNKGLAGFLQKPYSMQDVGNMINRVLKARTKANASAPLND